MAYTQEQLDVAATIVQVGRDMGMSDRDVQIGLMTAFQESGMRNLKYGDRDSQGVFQQRPSQGWGTVAQVTDVNYSSRKFFEGLQKVKGRDQMSLTVAAQKVQRSAFPNAYAKWANEAADIMGQAGGGKVAGTTALPGVRTAADGTTTIGTGSPLTTTTTTTTGLDTPDRMLEFKNPASAGQNAVGVGALGVAAAGVSLLNPTNLENLPSLAKPGQSDFVNIGPDPALATTTTTTTTTGGAGGTSTTKNSLRNQALAAAQTALGKPYTWGGDSLATGVDCSGLVQQSLKAAGVSIARVSMDQARAGARIDISALKPGDLVAWDNSSRNNGADHIAIYMGGGQIIEAAKPGTPVRTRKLGANEGAWGVDMTKLLGAA